MHNSDDRKRTIVIAAIVGTVLFFTFAGAIGIVAIGAIGRSAATVAGPSDDTTSTQAPSEFPDHAPAGATVAGTIASDPLAPFQIESCSGVLAPVTDADGHASSKLWVSVVIADSGDKPLVATQVKIAGIDARDATIADNDASLGTFLDDDTETIAAHEKYDSTGTFENASPLIERIACSQSKATFSDGSQWAHAGGP